MLTLTLAASLSTPVAALAPAAQAHEQGEPQRDGATAAPAVPTAPGAPGAPGVAAAAAKKHVYLTFDDGPSTYTPKILDTLRKYNVRATFFALGENVKRYPSTTRRAHTEGSSVQNHTWSHPDLTEVSASTFRSQINRTDSVIREQTGYTPQCLRPPYGAVNSTVRSRAASLDKTIRLWTVDPRDWSRPGSSVISSRVLNATRSGSIILLHDGGGDRAQTVAALPKILRTLKARGYTFYRMWCR